MRHTLATVMVALCSATGLLVGGCNHNNSAPQTGPGAAARLVPVSSDSALERYLKQGYERDYGTIPGASDDARQDGGGSSAPTASDGALENFSTSDAADAVSSTNLQVSGADEADRVKNDGEYLYSIALQRPSAYAIADVVTQTSIAESGDGETDRGPPPSPSIKVHRIQADPAASQGLAAIDVDQPGAHLKGLYLRRDAQGKGQQLIASGGQGPYWGRAAWATPWAWRSGTSRLWFFDVTQPAAARLTHKLSLEGYLLSSRRIGDTLYLVTRYTPVIPGYVTYPQTAAQRARNRQLLQATALDALLPQAILDQGAPQPLVRAEDCFLPDTTAPEDRFPTLTTITAIDLAQPDNMRSLCYGGRADGLYASTRSIYLSAADYNAPGSDSRRLSTIIHKFALSDAGPRYHGSGRVPGLLSINGSNPAFLMGERGEVLHVISGWWEDNRWRHQLSNLRANDDNSALELIAQLPNARRPQPIGKPGERIYASRYIGDRAYVVTFKTIDPLYVIDLSDAAEPQLAGELEMPGYSSYLHAVGEDLLLGIGKQATPDASGDFAWYQGLKLSLFDVSDIQAPRELSSLAIGGRGTDSPVLHDHHALSYLAGADAGTDTGTDRFTLPVSLYSAEEDRPPWRLGDWQHNGLYLFELDADAPDGSARLRHSGTLLAEQRDADQTWGTRSIRQDRAVIQGGAVHYLHQNQLRSADWAGLVPQ